MRGILRLLCGAGNKSVNPLHDALGERDRLLDGAPTANLATSGDSIFPGELGERDGVRIEDIQMQGSSAMLKHIALALLLGEQFVVAQYTRFYTIEEHEIGSVNKARCKDTQGFTCAVLFDFDPPFPDDPTSTEYDLLRGITVILDGTLYRAVYDPPLKREDGFSVLRIECNPGVLARIEGDYLLVRWPNGKEAKAKLVQREKIHSNRPQPA
jgi:hypothetical protein